jgi:selenide,water dikinase
VLDRLLEKLKLHTGGKVLIGVETLDDAGVYRLNDETALVQTVDFFTPIVDDPYDYGRIAAANSLSDVYAMGGRPITALNVLGYPEGDLDEEALALIMLGAREVCEAADVEVLGGHSVTDKELKFGLSVTGVVHPDKILTNSNIQPGDILVLTKPLGSGLIANAMMNDAVSGEIVDAAVEIMARLNRNAAKQASVLGANAVTDITGYGLLGHAREMALASDVMITLCSGALPLMRGALDIAKSRSYFSGGERRNLRHVESVLEVSEGVEESLLRIASDPQTSGGLLISLPADKAETLIRELELLGEPAWRIGMALEPELSTRLKLVPGTGGNCWEEFASMTRKAKNINSDPKA